jgi:hypothetical protein
VEDDDEEARMRRLAITAMTIGCGMLLAACSAGTSTTSAASGSRVPTSSVHTHTPSSTESLAPTEQPVPTESNPPGDIPDNTQFVPYHSKAGWTVSVPEGWARSTKGTTVTFTDKLNTVQVDAQPGAKVTPAGVKHDDVHQLAASTRAFTLQSVTTAHLPAGPAVLISYQANSDPNPVTGKQYRLDVLRYVLYRSGVRTTLTLLSPVGADNVDPWRIVTQSLRPA